MTAEPEADAELDCIGMFCPMPIAMTKEEIEKIAPGQVLKVEADDPAAEEDILRWARRTGHEIVKFQKVYGSFPHYQAAKQNLLTFFPL